MGYCQFLYVFWYMSCVCYRRSLCMFCAHSPIAVRNRFWRKICGSSIACSSQTMLPLLVVTCSFLASVPWIKLITSVHDTRMHECAGVARQVRIRVLFDELPDYPIGLLVAIDAVLGQCIQCFPRICIDFPSIK